MVRLGLNARSLLQLSSRQGARPQLVLFIGVTQVAYRQRRVLQRDQVDLDYSGVRVLIKTFRYKARYV